MAEITNFILHVYRIFTTNAEKGPRLFLLILAVLFVWIFFLQIIGADLWYDHGYAQITTVEEIK